METAAAAATATATAEAAVAAAAATAGLDPGGPSTMKNGGGKTGEEKTGVVENRPRFVPAYPPRGHTVRANRV